MDNQAIEETRRGGTSIHITALDGIINVNSLFTLAVFIGLAWNPNSDTTLLASTNCAAGNKIAEDLVSFHVFAFASFLFSSLIALCLKQAIRIVSGSSNSTMVQHHRYLYSEEWAVRVNRGLLRAGIVASAVGSVFGCGFLMLALVNVVQIKIGRIGCSGAATGAIVPLVTLIPVAMLVYIAIVFHAYASSR